MRQISASLVAALVFSFSPWLVGVHLVFSFGSESKTPITEQIRDTASSNIQTVISRRQYGNLSEDGDGVFTPLSEAILYSRREAIWAVFVEDLIRFGARVNEPTIFDTPLQTAAYKNDVEMMRLLIRKGAQVDFPNCRGETPLMKASITGNKEAILELLTLGANSRIRDINGRTALEHARTDDVRALLRQT